MLTVCLNEKNITLTIVPLTRLRVDELSCFLFLAVTFSLAFFSLTKANEHLKKTVRKTLQDLRLKQELNMQKKFLKNQRIYTKII